MPHIDEGNLHALLDGALTGDAAAAARAHLQLCSNCRARLDEAERIREQADAILAGAAPVTAAPPEFEEILARARAVSPSPQGPPRAGTPARFGAPRTLAWAASLVLALAGGWWAHELTRGPLMGTRSAAAPTGPQATPATQAVPTALAPAPSRTRLGAANDAPHGQGAEAAPAHAGVSGVAVPASIAQITAERPASPSTVLPGAAPAAPSAANVSAVPAGASAADVVATGFARARKEMAPPAAGELAAGTGRRADAAAPLAAKTAVAQEGVTAQRAPQPSAAPPPMPSSAGGAEPRDLLGPITVVEPTLLPYAVAPEPLNREEARRVLVREYPPVARESGRGGTTLLWLLVDTTGAVRSAQLKTSSGDRAIDMAALRVARVLRFAPALNRDQRVPFWVQVPVSLRPGDVVNPADSANAPAPAAPTPRRTDVSNPTPPR
jgi:TonB family protein